MATLDTKTTLYDEGDALYQSMLCSISSAKSEILFESYLFDVDEIGLLFINALNKISRESVTVKVHLDAIGSRYSQQGIELRKRLDENIQLKWFHRWSWRMPLQFNIRNHRKLLVIDNKLAFIGGFNIHKQCSFTSIGELRWKDCHLKLEGLVVQHFHHYFDTLWESRQQRYLGPLKDIDLVPNLSIRYRFLLRNKLKRLISNAKKSIKVTTPYFVPDEFIIKALINASKRNINVELLVPYESDHPIVNVLVNQYYQRLIKENIKVFAYIPRMIHSKTIVIDGKISVVGSANLDYRSLFINHELVSIIKSENLAKSLEKHFNKDSQLAIRVTTKTKFKIRQWWLWRPVAAILKHWV